MLAEGGNRLKAVACFRDHFDAVRLNGSGCFQSHSQTGANNCMIVGDNGMKAGLLHSR